MTAIYALTIILVIFAIGEFCSAKTNAVLSQPLVGAILMLLFFWLGFPKTLVADAGLNVIGSVISGILIAGVGSTINLTELVRQWKTILISVVSVIAGVAGIILVGSFIIGREQAAAGAPVFAGSISAVIIMRDHFNAGGREYLSALCNMILTVQTLVGLPLSTIMMRRAAKDFLTDKNNLALYSGAVEETTDVKKKPLQLPQSLSTSIIILAKLAVAAALANFLAGLTNNVVHYMVMAMFIGLIFTQLGLLEENAMAKTGCSSLFLVLILASLFESFSYITPQDLLGMIVPILVVLGLGSLFAGFVSILVASFTDTNPYLAIAMSLTCMYGFPTTLFISQDVAKACGSNDEERAALNNYLVPKIVTAGIATVTIASVIIASYVVKLV